MARSLETITRLRVALISAATLVVVVQLVGYFTWRFKTVAKLVDGLPRILVRHGHVCDNSPQRRTGNSFRIIRSIAT